MALFGTLETLKLQVCDSKFYKAFLYIEKLQDKNSSEYKSISNTKVDECNKIVLDENCFVLEQSYITKNKENCLFESHKKYIDVHYCLAGDEIISVVDKWDLEIKEDYDEMSEAYILEGKSKNRMELKKSEFLILFPEDAHMTALKGQQDFVKKLIFKVEI